MELRYMSLRSIYFLLPHWSSINFPFPSMPALKHKSAKFFILKPFSLCNLRLWKHIQHKYFSPYLLAYTKAQDSIRQQLPNFDIKCVVGSSEIVLYLPKCFEDLHVRVHT